MQIELAQEVFFKRKFCSVCTKQETIGDNHTTPATCFKAIHDKGNKQIRCFTRTVAPWEVAFYAIFRAASVWGFMPMTSTLSVSLKSATFVPRESQFAILGASMS